MANRYRKTQNRTLKAFAFPLPIIVCLVLLAGCSDIEKPESEPFYSETTPPRKQEFRWSNGASPKSLDPARASAAPETDIVRGLFEGLTDLDPRTLEEVPAVAEKWSNSADLRIWTFQLRKDARWSNGERVTADDFVSSWKRLRSLGDKVAHRELFQNIVGLRTPKTAAVDRSDFAHFSGSIGNSHPSEDSNTSPSEPNRKSLEPRDHLALDTNIENQTSKKPVAVLHQFGVEALNDSTLQITLESPDEDLPRLVANPIFRPIYGDGVEFDNDPLDADVVTNGPYTVASVAKDAITLDRSDSYWNKAAVSIERVRFVFKESAESALEAYKKGEIDALTNAEFEPLAVKILSPYDDFRQTTHSALNLYEFNTKNPPFNDKRVRESLAISIDRERLTDGELERTARPAVSFLPLQDIKNSDLALDIQRARQLLESAGFPAGTAFPKIRLLINRNDIQQRVARLVAKMWKQNLNIDTEIIVKDLTEMDSERAAGTYDLIRRGVVLPTVDQTVGMATIFGSPENFEIPAAVTNHSNEKYEHEMGGTREQDAENKADVSALTSAKNGVISEDEAISEVVAIPLYFPMAYSLVKPYIRGFDFNGLESTTLQNIRIDSDWRPKMSKGAH